jgi:2-polyprenyl-3-methyl-5-hydroxy-6-metoxy-1,4-benzoquinol methylase
MDFSNFKSRLNRIIEFDGNLVYGAKKFHAETHRIGPKGPASGFISPEHAAAIEDTGIDRYQRKEGFWENVDLCPICNGTGRELFVERMGLSFHRCLECTHVFQDPVIKPEVALKLYAGETSGLPITTSELQIKIETLTYKYGLDLLKSVGLPDQQKILDVGCGTGQFLRIAHQEGWAKCTGVDSNNHHKHFFEEKLGVQYFSGSFDSINTNNIGKNYDAVTMWNTLEHTYGPVNFLSNLKGIMKPDSLFCVMVPNVKSLATCLIRDRSPCFTWQHPHCFSPKSLSLLMEKAGLKIEHMETVVTEIDNIKSYLSGEHPYEGFGDPKNIFAFIDPDFIHKNLLGSRLLGVFRFGH